MHLDGQVHLTALGNCAKRRPMDVCSSTPGSFRQVRRVRTVWSLLLSVIALLLITENAQAYSWMMRKGYAKCETCHTDPSGGELLTHFGRVESDVALSQRWGEADEPPRDIAKFLFGIDEPDSLRLGGSFRYMTFLAQFANETSVSSFPMQIDMYGQYRIGRFIAGASFGVAKSTQFGDKHTAAAQITTNDGASQFNLLSRWHYIGWEVNDAVTLRAGRLNLPFGLRIPEHVMWARESTRTDRESDQQHGLAMAYSEGAWRGELMLSLGNYQVNPDNFRERGYSGYLEYLITPELGVGINSLMMYSGDDRLNPQGTDLFRTATGVMARAVVIEPVVVSGEFDLLTRTGASVGYTGLLQVDYEVLQGLHVTGSGELLDEGLATGGKFGGWVGALWFPIPHVDVRFDLVARQDSPFTVQTQAHLYF